MHTIKVLLEKRKDELEEMEATVQAEIDLIQSNRDETAFLEKQYIAKEEKMEILATPGESHWMHGLFERHGFQVKLIIVRTLIERPVTTVPQLVAVVEEAFFIKNCQASVDGHSAHQRLVGENPRMASLLTADPGSSTTVNESERQEIRGLLRKHLILLVSQVAAVIISTTSTSVSKGPVSLLQIS